MERGETTGNVITLTILERSRPSGYSPLEKEIFAE